MVALDTIFWLVGDGLLAVVAVLLLRSRAFRKFPVFTAYIILGLLSDQAEFAVRHFYPGVYYNVYTIGLAVDSIFQFGVLTELAWSVLRPVQASLPRWTILALALFIALVGAAVWPLSSGMGLQGLSAAGQLNVHVQETFSVLRILFFLVLAGCSQLLSIGWRDRELQIATGLGIYAFVDMAVWMQHRSGPQYHTLDELVTVSYLVSLVYWVFCFAQRETERREFTPQMQSFLLAVAGNARSTRVAMRESDRSNNRRRP